MIVALVGGLGLGFGLALLREMTDPAFQSPEDIQTFLKTEVIGSLPVVSRKHVLITTKRQGNGKNHEQNVQSS